jgi:hypothetical protein
MRDADVIGLFETAEECRSAASMLDGISNNVAKVDSLVANTNKLALGFTKNHRVANYVNGWQAKGLIGTEFSGYFARHVREIDQISNNFTRSQLGWLTKGFRAWNAHAADWLAVEVKRLPKRGFDLEDFLLRRQLEGLRRRANWAGRAKRGRVRAWLLSLGKAAFARIEQGLRAGAHPLHFFAPPGIGPPGWFATVRHRGVVEAALPKIIDQLAAVIAPNAPAPVLDLPRIPAGT